MKRAAWNLPPAMHRLTYLVSVVGALCVVLTLMYGSRWPLLARLALAHTIIVAAVVAVAASTRWTARTCNRLFCKNATTGLIAWPFVLLLWPYHLCVQIVCYFYRTSSGEEVFNEVTDNLYLGGWPLTLAMLPTPDVAVIDVSNELLRWTRTTYYYPLPVFESWAPEPEALDKAVDWALEQQAEGRPVFCHCTHGHGRSAVTAAAILMAMGQAATPEEALSKVVKARRGVKPNYRQIAMFREWAARRESRMQKEE